MRIAISALLGMTAMLSGASALAQPAPAPPTDAVPPADVPPPPPSPGVASPAEPLTPVPSPFPPEGESADERMDQVGFRMGGGFFIRDSRDNFRLYPHGLIQLDTTGFAGSGIDKVKAPDGTEGMKARLFARRVRLGLEGELLKRWSFAATFELGGQRYGNVPDVASGNAASTRYAPIESVAAGIYPADLYVGYSVCKCLNFQVGQFRAPFSMDNRHDDAYHSLMERPIAMGRFVMPSSRDLGGMIWGSFGPEVFNYEIGVFTGDGQNRPAVDTRADVMGRLFARPFAGGATHDLAKWTQIGVSARHGQRDPKSVAYDYSPITTGQGFVLWNPTYTDSLGRLTHVIPSGAQNQIGGELRMQWWRFSLQGEAYYVVNNTREAVDGYQLTNTERLGRLKGVGWYAQLTAWAFGDPFIPPEPGMSRPKHLDLRTKEPAKVPHGLELTAIVSGISANYDGASRLKSKADANSPSGDIDIYQVGGAVNYWHTRHVRLGIDYMAYLTPGSGSAKNLATVPDNLQTTNGKAATGHVISEIGGRITIGF